MQQRVSFQGPLEREVEVFDVAGHRLATLANEFFPAGSHSLTWAGEDHRGRAAAAGVYFCRLTVGADVQIRRMALIKKTGC